MVSNKYSNRKLVIHPFGPFAAPDSEILILGSFPSVKSREQMFYYGHPMNRFWRILAAIYQTNTPQTIDEKKSFCLEHHIALYDVIHSCEIKGSSDASIKNAIPSDILNLIHETHIKIILINGKKASDLFFRYQTIDKDIKVFSLPSTSPANAAISFESLAEVWGKAIR